MPQWKGSTVKMTRQVRATEKKTEKILAVELRSSSTKGKGSFLKNRKARENGRLLISFKKKKDETKNYFSRRNGRLSCNY
jgi:hypothetical protein